MRTTPQRGFSRVSWGISWRSAGSIRGATRQSFAAPPGPVASPCSAMPPNHGLRLDKQQRRTPVGPRPCEQRPETPIPSAEPGPRAAPPVDGELLPQGEVLEEEGRPRPERPPEAAEKQHDIKHRRHSTRFSGFRRDLTGAWIGAVQVHNQIVPPFVLARPPQPAAASSEQREKGAC